MTEQEIKAKLDELGIEYDGRWGVDRLSALLPKTPDMVMCQVQRDYWPTDDEMSRVRKGEIVEVSTLEALDGIESGALKRIK